MAGTTVLCTQYPARVTISSICVHSLPTIYHPTLVHRHIVTSIGLWVPSSLGTHSYEATVIFALRRFTAFAACCLISGLFICCFLLSVSESLEVPCPSAVPLELEVWLHPDTFDAPNKGYLQRLSALSLGCAVKAMPAIRLVTGRLYYVSTLAGYYHSNTTHPGYYPKKVVFARWP